MRGNDRDGTLNTTVQFRASESTTEFLDDLVESWDLDSRSDALRIIIHSWAGVLNGNFWAITDPEKLSSQWGDVGNLLATAHEAKGDLPPPLQDACLLDVVDDIPILLGAAEQELGLHPPNANVGGDTGSMPDVGAEVEDRAGDDD